MNVTDVGHLTDDGDDGEDKMIKSAREQGMSVWDIAKHFTEAFFLDTEALHIMRPHTVAPATEHIGDMIGLIKKLEDKGFTYQSDGNVYFDVSRFPEYGKMALLDKQELQHGARIAVDVSKKNPQDFVLWFTNSKFDNQAMVWDSPWGRGYPGWHLECSAMSMKYLGETFDIHCGGIDHIPVHHTNEIAQSEAATGKEWVRFWLHGEFLLDKTGKMSKRKGKFLTLTLLKEKGYNPMDYRFFLLGAHYRSQLIFSWEALDSSRKAREKLFRRIRDLKSHSEVSDVISEALKPFIDIFKEHISADLNTPRTLADLWSLLKDSSLSDGDKLTGALEIDKILGLGLAEIPLEDENKEVLDPEYKSWIDLRLQAKRDKNFALADEYRTKLTKAGIQIMDTPEGTKWEKVQS